ncbi:MAG: trigger factor [Ignavibacteria bacterium]|nr:trigger factor [Ignavibacteria bacterium]MBT8391134.1 trigger factor [Ignavibacteria bacterium]NNJ52168.1 trigger factor [Ignavibacteriaceae bacterium]NNL20011.1 trigger factor [Ignavibacteriaceae bacterium]
MDFKVNELSSSEKEVEVTLSYDEIKNDIDSEVKKQAKDIQLPGFRKGKVPKHLLKQRFGDTLEYEASEKVANTYFWKLAQAENLNPIGQPTMTDIKFKPGEDFSFKVKYETLPALDVKNYTDQNIEVPDIQVKDNEVEKEIDYILRSNSTQEEAEIVGDDNHFLLDVTMTRLNENGDPFENIEPEKLEIDLTNSNVHTDVKENAKGKKVGDNFNFSFDDERVFKNKDGQDEKIKEHYDYKVHINGIKKIVLPELNEELIKKVTKDKVSTKEELRTEIRKDIQNYYAQRVEEFTRNSIIGLILKNNEFTPPASLVTDIQNEMVKTEEEKLRNQGTKKIDQKQIQDYFKPMAENDVKWFLLKNEIMKKEKIEVPESELEEMAKKDAEKTGLPVEKLVNYYKTSQQNDKLLDKKLFDFLIEKNKIEKVNPDKFSKRQKEITNEK